jgi:hypothetical protein
MFAHNNRAPFMIMVYNYYELFYLQIKRNTSPWGSICLGFVYLFNNSNIGLKINMLYWENDVINENVLNKGVEYKLKDRRVYDNNNTIIFDFRYLNYIEEGNLKLLDNNTLAYAILFSNNKCVIKDSNKKIVIKSGDLCKNNGDV